MVNIAGGSGYVINRFGHDVLAVGDGNLYSFLVGLLYALVGHVRWCWSGASRPGFVAMPVLYAIAERPFGSQRAALGAALAALHPGLIAYTLKLLNRPGFDGDTSPTD